MEYTKGEWEVLENADKKQKEQYPLYVVARFPNGSVEGIALLKAHPYLPKVLANAQLIISAPDMYEALKGIDRRFEQQDKPTPEYISKALSKAEGIKW